MLAVGYESSRKIVPFYETTVAAGFPSPAEDEMGEKLDLNELLIKHPAATFFVRVKGSAMINAGIHHDDILIVDRSIEPAHDKVVIATVDGELAVKRLCKYREKYYLVSENAQYPPVEINKEVGLHIWGVVTTVLHNL